eukprot:snap_masked-scaffold_29-processed-gene-0.32-mRNA-1 protein AED:1.00 eAED:1.00 QI:0/0/0/0/1/1/2/0/69
MQFIQAQLSNRTLCQLSPILALKYSLGRQLSGSRDFSIKCIMDFKSAKDNLGFKISSNSNTGMSTAPST